MKKQRQYTKDKLYLLLNDKYNVQLLDEELEDIVVQAEILSNSSKVGAKALIVLYRVWNIIVLGIIALLIRVELIEPTLLIYLGFNIIMLIVLAIRFKTNKWKKF